MIIDGVITSVAHVSVTSVRPVTPSTWRRWIVRLKPMESRRSEAARLLGPRKPADGTASTWLGLHSSGRAKIRGRPSSWTWSAGAGGSTSSNGWTRSEPMLSTFCCSDSRETFEGYPEVSSETLTCEKSSSRAGMSKTIVSRALIEYVALVGMATVAAFSEMATTEECVNNGRMRALNPRASFCGECNPRASSSNAWLSMGSTNVRLQQRRSWSTGYAPTVLGRRRIRVGVISSKKEPRMLAREVPRAGCSGGSAVM